MSRSRKKTPISGWSCKESDKKDKQLSNRKFRKIAKELLKKGEFEMLPMTKEEVSEVCSYAKDGKQYLSKEYAESYKGMMK